MSSNSPQADVIARAINQTRSTRPGHIFPGLGDLLATPELSAASPWLNRSTVQLQYGITDEAYEKIPGQILSLVRMDSIGSAANDNGQVAVRFSGEDGYTYAVQASSNLLDWVDLGTNYPEGGRFQFMVSPPPDLPQQFYRSELLP